MPPWASSTKMESSKRSSMPAPATLPLAVSTTTASSQVRSTSPARILWAIPRCVSRLLAFSSDPDGATTTLVCVWRFELKAKSQELTATACPPLDTPPPHPQYFQASTHHPFQIRSLLIISSVLF